MEKTIFITGTIAGFGGACAQSFARAGWRLIVTGLSARTSAEVV
jgi:NADP-dependent 3-hydroxy acid dehydrogenase YdfG